MAKVALKLINCAQFQLEEGHYWTSDEKDSHTLHYAISTPDSFSPGLARYFIQRYSGKKDIVLDPFCGRGTVPLEAALMERRTFATDINPIFAKISAAKLNPVDLVDVAMFLQGVNFSRPVSLEGYFECFSHFFDPDTYREIVNLKSAIATKGDHVARFVELITLSILHGHTAGYLSAYSLPQISVSPDHQKGMNDRRGSSPEYRAVAPRVLKKVGLVMRDGDRQRIRDYWQDGSVFQADARNLSHIGSSSVDLVVTAPPRLNARPGLMDQWLRGWFCGLTTRDQKACLEYSFAGKDFHSWCDFMNPVMFELARVVKSGGRAAFDLGSSEDDSNSAPMDEVFKDMVQSSLSSYWETESLIVNKPVVPQLAGRARTNTTLGREARVLVLRRR
jgi:DNA modification methylase